MAKVWRFNPLDGSIYLDETGSTATDSFNTIATPSGTSPVADSNTDTLTLSSTDSNIVITGNSGADSVDFQLAGTISGAKTFSNQVTISSDLLLGSLVSKPLSSTIILLDNTSSVAFSYAKTNEFVIVEYSLSRDSNRRVGRLLIINNGSSVVLTDDLTEINGDIGISFSASVNGSNIDINYTSTLTGFNANMKYAARQWV